MITWDDSMTTGLSNLDAQHREIIGKLNELSEALAGGQDRARVAGEILDFLQFYAAWHFEREEALMEQYQCPIAETNKKEHVKFVERFGQFYEQWQTASMDLELVNKTHAELANWIANHILQVDTQLYAYVKNQEGTS
jgi:hemerythrin